MDACSQHGVRRDRCESEGKPFVAGGWGVGGIYRFD